MKKQLYGVDNSRQKGDMEIIEIEGEKLDFVMEKLVLDKLTEIDKDSDDYISLFKKSNINENGFNIGLAFSFLNQEVNIELLTGLWQDWEFLRSEEYKKKDNELMAELANNPVHILLSEICTESSPSIFDRHVSYGGISP